MKSTHLDAHTASLCNELRPEDGVPTHLREPQHRRSAALSNIASARYVKAAVRAVESALAGFAEHPQLGSLSVTDAQLHPGGAVLEIALYAPEHRYEDIEPLEHLLASFSGHFRDHIAAEVNRRRTPHLRLRVIPGSL
jgi:hypothetical protein